jgi:hypothetical protein
MSYESGETLYLSVAESAKLIRAALKKAFGKQKFSVRSSSYAGGASVSIAWTDGPTTKAVDAVVQPFSSRGFDGSIDMAYSKTSYMLPDGTVTYGETEGTSGSMGYVTPVKNPLPEGARKVHFGSNYVSTSRANSAAAVKAALEAVVEKFGNQVGLPEDLSEAVEVSKWSDSAWIAAPWRDKDVTGEPGWNMYWSVGSKVTEYLSEH